MRYATIRKIDISNGPYIGVSLFLQGCLFHCLLQATELSELLKEIKETWPEKEIWLWTGFYISELTEEQMKVINLCDYIVDGRYIDELKDRKLRFRGSSNQTIWHNINGELVKSKYNDERLD